MSGWRYERVVVEVHLRVERQQVAVGGHDQRVDLDHRRVGALERLVEREHQLGGLAGLRGVQAQRKRQLASLERHQAGARADVLLEDAVRRLRRDLFDVHAAVGAGHENRARRSAVEDERQVELARDPQPLFHEHARDQAAFRTGLVRLERHADHVARDPLGFVGVLGQLHAAALAASAGMNLRLDDDGAAAEPPGNLAGLGRVERHLALRNGHAIPREDGLGLIFVDFHRVLSGAAGRGGSDRRDRRW